MECALGDERTWLDVVSMPFTKWIEAYCRRGFSRDCVATKSRLKYATTRNWKAFSPPFTGDNYL